MQETTVLGFFWFEIVQHVPDDLIDGLESDSLFEVLKVEGGNQPMQFLDGLHIAHPIDADLPQKTQEEVFL